MKTLAIIVPVHNEQASLPSLPPRLDGMAKQIEALFPLQVSYVFVDDGSKDDSFAPAGRA